MLGLRHRRARQCISFDAGLGYSGQHVTIKQDYRTLKFQRNAT